MCRYAGKVYIILGRSEEICDIAGDTSRFFHFESKMRPEHIVHIVDDTAFDHSVRAPHPFFGRLEAELDGASKLSFELSEQLCKEQPHRGVSIMAAGMHRSRMAGSKTFLIWKMRGICRLRYIIGVHVKADADDRAVIGEMHYAQYACLSPSHFPDPVRICPFGNRSLLLSFELFLRRHTHHCFFLDGLLAGLHFIAQCRERLCYLGCRAEFCPTRLRIPMKITAALDHIRQMVICKF